MWSGKTKVLGVFGHPIAHSLSPAMQNAALQALGFDFVYVPFDIEPGKLGAAVAAIRALDIVGVNVTIPHKEKVIDYLDEVSEEARLVGSVNTIHNDRGRLKGYSTDGKGFLGPLQTEGFHVEGSRAVVLGAGGSAKAVAHALVANGSRVTVINRTAERGAALAEQINRIVSCKVVRALRLDESDTMRKAIKQADLLINCTSVGMHPDIERSPCPKALLHPKLMVYDLVYNPVKTRLLQEAEEVGAKTISGAKMLVYQGAESFRIWLNLDPPRDIMEQIVMSVLAA